MKFPDNIYIVRPSDNFGAIAAAHNMAIKDLEKLNPQIKNINDIYKGQKIKIAIDEDNKSLCPVVLPILSTTVSEEKILAVFTNLKPKSSALVQYYQNSLQIVKGCNSEEISTKNEYDVKLIIPFCSVHSDNQYKNYYITPSASLLSTFKMIASMASKQYDDAISKYINRIDQIKPSLLGMLEVKEAENYEEGDL